MSLFKRGDRSILPRREDFFAPFETAIDRMVDEVFGNDFLEGFKGARFPKLNAYEREGHWIIEAGVPGVKADELDVQVTDGVLTISGKMNADEEIKDAEYYVRELSHKAFRRQIRLPETIEGDPDATLKEGLLTLKWKLKAEVVEKSQVKKVEIKES